MSLLRKLFGRRADAPRLLDAQEYTRAYAAFLGEALPLATVQVELGTTAADCCVQWEEVDGLQHHQFMGNWYARYLQDPAAPRSLFEVQLSEARKLQTALANGGASGCFLPVLKSAAWLRTAQAQLDQVDAPQEQRSLAVAFGAHLVLTYVEDLPDSMSFVAPARLQREGLSLEALHAAALDNLAAKLPDLRVQGGNGRYGIRLDGCYDASMILLFDAWRGRLELRGEPVFAIAARDDLLVCGSEDAEAIASLRDMAAQIAETAPYGLSAELFVWRDGQLEVLPA